MIWIFVVVVIALLAISAVAYYMFLAPAQAPWTGPAPYTGPADDEDPDPHGTEDDSESMRVLNLTFRTGKACYMGKSSKGWILNVGDKQYHGKRRTECLDQAEADADLE